MTRRNPQVDPKPATPGRGDQGTSPVGGHSSARAGPTSDCPDADALERFLQSDETSAEDTSVPGTSVGGTSAGAEGDRGGSPKGAEGTSAEAELIAAHLDVCERCRQRVQSEPAEAAWTEELRCAGHEIAETSVDVSVPLARLRTVLTDYEIIAEIGRGGMGIVYEARQIALNRIVALKILPALLNAVRPGAAARFRREAELAAQLKHNNITAVYDFGEIDGTLYYAMELIEGRSLREILREIEASGAIDAVIDGRTPSGSVGTQSGSVPTASDDAPQASAVQSKIPNPQSEIGLTRLGSSSNTDKVYYRQVARWIAEVAEALDYAHGMGIIHRDVKPSNLLLSAEGRLMISDFGLARASGLESMTVSRALLGTARYMSPEQVDENAGPIDGRVDVYALGATLYELLAFRPMFAAADDREVLNQVLNKDPTAPHRFVRQVPRELETICLKAIEKDRANRYASAKAFRDDLERWLLDLPIHAKRPTLPARTIKFVRRRKLPVALTAAVAVLLIATGLFFAGYRSWKEEAVTAKSVAQDQGVQLTGYAHKEAFQEGDFEPALEKIDALLAEDPERVDWQLARATVLWQLHRKEEALAYVEGIVAAHPDSWQAHDLLATGYEALKQSPEKVAHHLQRAQELMPADETAFTYFTRATWERDPERAIELLTKSIELDPTDWAAVVARCQRYRALMRHDLMLRDAERLIGMRPRWSGSYELRGIASLRLARYEDAVRDFSRAVELDPEAAESWSNRGDARNHLGRFADAIADADVAVSLKPQLARAYAVRGLAKAGLGDLDGGLEDLDRAMELEPTDAQLYLTRCKVLGDADRHDEVIRDATRAIEHAPNDARGYHNRALSYVHTQRYDEAIADFTRVVELDPSARCYHVRGQIYVRMQRFDEAIYDLTRALEMEPRNQVARLRRGMAYELSGNSKPALADYERTARLGGSAGEYARLWRYILLRQDGEAAAADDVLASRGATESEDVWLDGLFEFFAGSITADELLAAAVTDDQRAEAHYYIGRKALLDDHPDEAKDAFTKCVALDRNDVLETDFARAYLQQ